MLEVQLLGHNCPPQHTLPRMGCSCCQAAVQPTPTSSLVWAHVRLHVTSPRTGSDTWKIHRETLFASIDLQPDSCRPGKQDLPLPPSLRSTGTKLVRLQI